MLLRRISIKDSIAKKCLVADADQASHFFPSGEIEPYGREHAKDNASALTVVAVLDISRLSEIDARPSIGVKAYPRHGPYVVRESSGRKVEEELTHVISGQLQTNRRRHHFKVTGLPRRYILLVICVGIVRANRCHQVGLNQVIFRQYCVFVSLVGGCQLASTNLCWLVWDLIVVEFEDLCCYQRSSWKKKKRQTIA